ncbi:MAG: autotransporter-associated beta strand repeat-containing protein, partial [Verrucomicrobiota bacterium]
NNTSGTGTLALTKAGTGTLTLSGTNIYTGNTLVSAGTLQFAKQVALYNNGAAAAWSRTNINVNSGATMAFNIGGTGEFTKADVITLLALSNGANGFQTGSILGLDTTSGNFTYDSAIANPNSGANVLGLTKLGTNTLTLSSTNTYTGATTITQGTLQVGISGALPNGTGKGNVVFSTAANSAVLDINGIDTTINGLSQASASTTNKVVNNATGTAKTLTVGNADATSTFAGIIANNTSGTGTLALTKAGTGTLTLSAANTYTGATTISGGTLALGATGSITSPNIIVGASTTFDVSSVTGGYTLGAAQTLSGTGSVVGSTVVAGTLSPGNSPGSMSVGSQTWVNGGNYNWQILNATGSAGADYDTIAMTGNLNLSNLTAGGFGINLWSLVSISPDSNGNALHFDNTLNQSWTLLTASGAITGFDAADFVIKTEAANGTGGFSNSLGGGAFTIGTSGNSLVLNFTAIPEPNVAALIGALGGILLLRRRR